MSYGELYMSSSEKLTGQKHMDHLISSLLNVRHFGWKTRLCVQTQLYVKLELRDTTESCWNLIGCTNEANMNSKKYFRL